MFVGREAELKSLNKGYRKAGFQFPVLYGRRRVEKKAGKNGDVLLVAAEEMFP
jgi:AAA+ ATPase superfamily predicted ATPase